MWVQPIFDRNEQDIVERTPKAYLSYTDINRISDNMNYLCEKTGRTTVIKRWAVGDIPTSGDFSLLLDNLNYLISNTGIIGAIVPVQPINTFEKVNDIERLQNSVYKFLEMLEASRMYCGECHVGDGIGVL